MKMIQDENGGSLVEFAIVMPLLLLIVGGIIDFGALYYNKQVLTNASREAARAGIVNIDSDGDGNKDIIIESDLQDIVDDYCDKNGLWPFAGLWRFGGISSPKATAPGVGSLAYPNDLTVTVTFTHTFLLSSLLNLFGGSLGPTLDISAVTVMRME